MTLKDKPQLFLIPGRCHSCKQPIKNIEDAHYTWDKLWFHRDCFGRNRG